MADSRKPIPIKHIASEEGISPEFLEQIFFKLKKAGIISSVRGPGGGFILEKDPNAVSVKNIFDAVGEGLEITPCTGEDDCDRSDNCMMKGVWEDVSTHIVSYFEKLTLRRIIDMNQDKVVDTMISGNEFSV